MAVRCAWQGFDAWTGSFWVTTGSGDLPRGLDGTKSAGLPVNDNGIAVGDGILVLTVAVSRVACDGTDTSVQEVTDSVGNTYEPLPDFFYNTGPATAAGPAMALEAWWCPRSAGAIGAGTSDPADTTDWILAEWDKSTAARVIWAFGIRGHRLTETFINPITVGDTDSVIRDSLEIDGGSQTWEFTKSGGLVLSQAMYVEEAGIFHDAGGFDPVGSTFQDYCPFVGAFAGFGTGACATDAVGMNANAVVRLASVSGTVAVGEETFGTTSADDPGIVWPAETGGAPYGLWKLLLAFGIEPRHDGPRIISGPIL